MKRWIFVIFLSLMVLVPATGCNNGPLTVATGETFTMALGRSVKIPSESLEITFNSVIGDSRCPQNATCVWEGVASCEITIDYQGKKYPLAINQPGLTEKAEDTFFDYILAYSLNPYPIAGEGIAKNDYRLTMTISK